MRARHKFTWIILACCVFIWNAKALDYPLIVDNGKKEVFLPANNFLYLIYSDSLADLDSDHQLLERDVFALAYKKSTLNLVGELRNAGINDRRYILELASPSLDRVTVMITTGPDTLVEQTMGDRQGFTTRPYYHRNFIVPFRIDAGETVRITMTVAPQREALSIPFRITTESYFLGDSVRDQLLLGGLIGMYAIYIIFILALFILVRNRLFLYYALIDLFMLAYVLFETGYGFQTLWPGWPYLQTLVVPMAAFAYFISIISFTREFFSTRIKYPLLDKLLVGYLGLSLVSLITVLLVFHVYGVQIMIPLIMATIIFTALAVTVMALGTVTYLQAGRREGFWFLFLFFIHLIMFVLILNQKGYFGNFLIPPDSALYIHLPIFTNAPHFIMDMMVFEMIIVSTIIAFRFQDVLDEYNITRRRIESINQSSIKALIKGQEEERKTLSQRLHQEIGMDLNTIGHDLQKVEERLVDADRIGEAIHQLQDVKKDLNRIAADIIDWKMVRLHELITKVFDELRMAMSDLDIQLRISEEVRELRTGDLTKLNLYRILQEACNNIIKHSEAHTVRADIGMEEHLLLISVTDDGIGFDKPFAMEKRGIGIRNMETRIKALNGELNIVTAPQEGTRISLLVPVEHKMVVS